MENRVRILMLLMSGIMLSACGQSGPLYRPGQATGAHKKDVFVLGDDQSKPKSKSAATADNTENKVKPPQKATESDQKASQEESSAQTD